MGWMTFKFFKASNFVTFLGPFRAAAFPGMASRRKNRNRTKDEHAIKRLAAAK